MKFIHAADIHIDSPLRGLDRYEGAPAERIRGSTRRAFSRLCDLALDERVDFVLLAGDLYDGDWKDYNTGLFIVREMQRLREAGIQAFVVAGNHDAASQISRVLRMPDNVHLFATGKPETVELGATGAAIHGQGFATAAVTDNLAAGFPARRADLFNIGLLHTSLDGREGHASYAPCGLDTLRTHGYGYWALGHVHAREIVAREPWVVFPGNLQGRHARETGSKGCTLVTVEDLAVRTVEHRDLTDLRWEQIAVDVGGVDQSAELYTRIERALGTAVESAEDRLLAVRVCLRGATPMHGRLRSRREEIDSECRALALRFGGERVWLEKLQIETVPLIDQHEGLTGDDALGALLRAIRELAPDEPALAALGEELGDLAGRLPHGMRDGAEGFDPMSPATIRAALDDVRELLVDRLLASGAGA